MDQKIRWGIVGAGAVIHRWMKGALQLEDMEVVTITSRHLEKARNAALKWKIPKVMTYEEMLASPEIDVVYIATPHTSHKELAVQAIEAGKNVLVEKPAVLNAKEFQELAACAREHQVFLMEGMWTRFFPIMQRALHEIDQGRIGEVRVVQSNFSFCVSEKDSSRLTDLNRGGGSLLDTGVYNLHFGQGIYGKSPRYIKGAASVNTDDNHYQVDEQAAYIGQYDNGALSVMMSGIRTETLHTAWIYGTKGYMVLPVFWKPTTLEIVTGYKKEIIEEKVPQKIEGIEDEGYQYQIAHVNGCIRQRKTESPIVPLQTTMAVLEQMDSLRKDWNLVYPQEYR